MSDRPDLQQWQAPEGVLRDYERVWLPTSDAPREYQIACSLSTVSAMIENRVYLPFGGDRLYPNLWILLLGPSSFFWKDQHDQQSEEDTTSAQRWRYGNRGHPTPRRIQS